MTSPPDCDDALIELESPIVAPFGQGMADVTCSSRCGVPVGLFTSMTGSVKYPIRRTAGDGACMAGDDAC